ncbi:hypothetical protein NQZ68_026626 [Dissostichus eleginoides]|nr:hypothetical protein NQZ68_026626 [Dissostichus eleginoides]
MNQSISRCENQTKRKDTDGFIQRQKGQAISSSTSGFIILIVVIIIPLQPRAFWLSVSAACSIFTEHLTADYTSGLH